MYRESSEDLKYFLEKYDLQGSLIDSALTAEEHSPALESFALYQGISLSEEGVINWAVDKAKQVIHKFHIFANEAWSHIARSNDETKAAIRRAELIGFKHDEKLPVNKGLSLVFGLGLMVAAVGACVVAVKGIREGQVALKRHERSKRVRALLEERRATKETHDERGKRWVDNAVQKATEQRIATIQRLQAKAKRGELTLRDVEAERDRLNHEFKSALSQVETNLKDSGAMTSETAAYISAIREKTDKVVRHSKTEHAIFDSYQKWNKAKTKIRDAAASHIHDRRLRNEQKKAEKEAYKRAKSAILGGPNGPVKDFIKE